MLPEIQPGGGVALGLRGSFPSLSSGYISQHNCICFMLLMQLVRSAFSLARARAGSSIAARIAMIAMTTSNSMRVKPPEATIGERPLAVEVEALAVRFIVIDGVSVEGSALKSIRRLVRRCHQFSGWHVAVGVLACRRGLASRRPARRSISRCLTIERDDERLKAARLLGANSAGRDAAALRQAKTPPLPGLRFGRNGVNHSA